MSGPRTAINKWMAEAKPGDVMYSERTDVSIQADTGRNKKHVTTERGVFVSGPRSKPTAIALTRITMVGDRV